jgi:hypothetical protein
MGKIFFIVAGLSLVLFLDEPRAADAVALADDDEGNSTLISAAKKHSAPGLVNNRQTEPRARPAPIFPVPITSTRKAKIPAAEDDDTVPVPAGESGPGSQGNDPGQATGTNFVAQPGNARENTVGSGGKALLGTAYIGTLGKASNQIYQQAKISYEAGIVQAAAGAAQVAEATAEFEADPNPAPQTSQKLDVGFANIAQGSQAINLGRKLYYQAKKVEVDEAKVKNIGLDKNKISQLPPLEADVSEMGGRSSALLEEFEIQTGVPADDFVRQVNAGGSPYDTFSVIQSLSLAPAEMQSLSEGASLKIGSSAFLPGGGTMNDIVAEVSLRTDKFPFGSAAGGVSGQMDKSGPADSHAKVSGSRSLASVYIPGGEENFKRTLEEERESFKQSAGADIFEVAGTSTYAVADAEETADSDASLFDRVRGRIRVLSRAWIK